jgi:hypothetical protein
VSSRTRELTNWLCSRFRSWTCSLSWYPRSVGLCASCTPVYVGKGMVEWRQWVQISWSCIRCFHCFPFPFLRSSMVVPFLFSFPFPVVLPTRHCVYKDRRSPSGVEQSTLFSLSTSSSNSIDEATLHDLYRQALEYYIPKGGILLQF